MRKRSERIRCSPSFKAYLDELNEKQQKRETYPKVTDRLAEFLRDEGFAEKKRRNH